MNGTLPRPYRRFLALFFVLSILPPPVRAQRYTFGLYGQEKGLKGPGVVCLLQDHAGFLWVGTRDGLFRYDGGHFQAFGTAEGLPASSILSLHESPDGTLWVGTPAGLAHRDGERFQTVRLQSPEPIDSRTQPAGSTFSVPPAWWLRGLAVAGLLFLGWLAYRLRLARVHAQLARIIEERTRIARELHDTVLQKVTGVSMLLERFHYKAVDPDLRENLGLALSELDDSIAETSKAVWDLRSAAFERKQFPEALSEVGTNLTARSGISFEFQLQGVPVACPRQVERELLRVAQEAIHNAVKHSRASVIRLHLEYTPESMVLIAEDSGVGFDASGPMEGCWGLIGMRERVQQLGGDIGIVSAAGQGTRIRIQMSTTRIRSHVRDSGVRA